MSDFEIKQNIQSALKSFQEANLTEKSLNLFKNLGYNTKRQAPLDKKTYKGFKDAYLDGNTRFNEEKAVVSEWKYIDLLFQLSKDEITTQIGLFDTKRVDRTIIETYLFFVIELSKESYSRSALSHITREMNKVFPMPVMVLFKHGKAMTLAVINRRLHKKDEQKDVLEKVTLIKDINVENPHRAHIEILFDLSLEELQQVHKFTNFVELHNAWQKTLDTKELNKKFYNELSNWYFWAMKEVDFPSDELHRDKKSLFKEEDKEKEHNAKNLIRLLTRLLFVWFVKEKGLIPEEIFDEKYVANELLLNFRPKKGTGASGNITSCYYRAILQNLFFATLNQNMGKREFRKSGQHMNVTNLMRYERYFKDSQKFIQLVEKIVPFMNGGLFECLDRPDLEKKGKQGGDVIVYLDGFSDREDNHLAVPDYIFFGTEGHVDLSDAYGDKAKEYKNTAVKGLINILKSYKFTVAENTPLEEEIALDPELLGQVFENLLASYNPETKTTARKQTGSFYTPREIVNYMVDESLTAYLKQKLEDVGIKDKEINLRDLISYSENSNPFNAKETHQLINAIDSCKILDPACGSGAFPMGILHKLVHILHKLDPKNALWKQRQIAKVEAIDDSIVRDQDVADIEEAFENNELDYGRKLYLIENCIYGVDIQPIATQISKLRFFISLIVDQKVNVKKDNYGIRPLPNLETKFVAANTLIGIEKPKAQITFGSDEVKVIEEQLKDVRHKLFSAKTPSRKRKLREQDKEHREHMGRLLVKNGWKNEAARQLSGWDPYDQNASSSFFDTEWMFGLIDGFDIVIGNPPYINISNLKPDDYRLALRSRFRSARNKVDTYAFFLEQGFNFLNANGELSYIIPQTWKATESFSILREIIFKEHSLARVVDLNFGTFEAIVKPMLVFISNEFGKHKTVTVLNSSFEIISKIDTDEILMDRAMALNTNLNSKEKDIYNKIENGSVLLESIIQFSRGIKTSNDARFIHRTKDNKDYQKVYRGKNIKSYQLNWDGEYIWYRPDLMKEKVGSVSYTKEFFEVPEKLVTQRVNSSMQLLCTYDDKRQYFLDTTIVSRYETRNKNISLKYLCALLNSKLINYWYCNKYLMPTIGVYELHSIPIRITQHQDKVSRIVEFILFLKAGNKNQQLSVFFEYLIDAMVYEFYFPQEIKLANSEVLEHLTDFQELKDDWSDDKKLAIIENIYNELTDPKHSVSIAMVRMKEVPEIKIIEGKN